MPVCRNGRRGRLKICCMRVRVGSSPTTGTKSVTSESVLPQERTGSDVLFFRRIGNAFGRAQLSRIRIQKNEAREARKSLTDKIRLQKVRASRRCKKASQNPNPVWRAAMQRVHAGLNFIWVKFFCVCRPITTEKMDATNFSLQNHRRKSRIQQRKFAFSLEKGE